MSRIALAQITRTLDDLDPAQQFLKNARDHGHHVEQTQLDLVLAQGDSRLSLRLFEAGLQGRDVERLLKVPSWRTWNEVPYGAYRNAALFTALLEGIDYLIFFDSDVWPRELVALEGRKPLWNEVDVVGEHLAALTLPGVAATSSEYSGYYIVPPMAFDGLDQLLIGLGKGSDPECLARLVDDRCLAISRPGNVRTRPTKKLLGGNLGLSLRNAERLLPFYSSGFEFWGLYVLGRGEDTFLSYGLADLGSEMIDIRLPVFHDTFVNFPSPPRIQSSAVRDRFYNACLGWIGRNPLLAWHQAELGLLETSLEQELERQRRGLRIGGEKAAGFLLDDRFETLEHALESSIAVLPQAIERYGSLMSGWSALQAALADRSYNLERLGVEPA
jgi:hypothetical protein